MRIAILETGSPSNALRERHGGYAHMFEQAFKQAGQDVSFTNYPIYENNIFPALGDYDGYIISGSPFGVYEDHNFIAPLEDYLKIALEARIPVVGICFGHQIMARAFGARVEKSSKGWGVGVHHYETKESLKDLPLWLRDHCGDEGLSCVVSHQDQVLEIPDTIQCVLGSDFCPNGVLLYAGGMGVSFQMHPEFTHEFSLDLLNSRRDRIATDIADIAQESLRGVSDRQDMILLLVGFFQHHLGVSQDRIQQTAS